MSPAFARLALRTGLLLLAFAVVLFAVISNRLLRRQSERSLREQAELFAAAVATRPDHAVTETLTGAVARNDRIVAVAMLNTFGRVTSLYPDRPAHQELLSEMIKLDGARRRVASPEDGSPVTIATVTVPLPDALSASNAAMVLLLKVESYFVPWLGATAVFALFVAVMALIGARALYRWFESHVAEPLRSMAACVSHPNDRADVMRPMRVRRWRETAQIAERFEEFEKSLAESAAQVRQVEHASKQSMRDREIGFDKQLRRAKELATTDPLTRLRNRTYLDENLEPTFEAHRGGDQPLSAVMIDLDNFKPYNDKHGHQVGDALLNFVGALLRGSIRPTDHAIRYGGDEFLLLLPGANAEQAGAIADRIIKLFGQYTSRLGKGDQLSMSAGVASTPQTKCDGGHELIAKADRALYSAKQQGKNAVVQRAGVAS